MSVYKLKIDVTLLAIVDVILLLLIISSIITFQNYENKYNLIKGRMTYISEISNPENPQIGVYLKIHLEYPKYAKFGEEGYAGFLVIVNTSNEIGIILKNKTANEKAGFVVDVKDNNNNGVIDSGDVFHIYGRPLNGYKIIFCIDGIGGGIHITISYKARESGNMFEINNTIGEFFNSTFGNTNENRKYALMTIVNPACYSGTMMPHLAGKKRILISTADSEHEAWTEYAYTTDPPFQHFAFIYQV